MALLIAPVLFIAVVIYVAYPLVKEEEGSLARERDNLEREKLLEEKEEAIANLKDIEMDYRMGKLSQGDYENLKLDFEQRAVEVFRRLESVNESRKARKK